MSEGCEVMFISMVKRSCNHSTSTVTPQIAGDPGVCLRNMDTQSTIANENPVPMQAASALEMGLPKWELARVLREGYFCLISEGEGNGDWPSLDFVETAHGKEGLLDFALEMFAWSPMGLPELEVKEVMKKMTDKLISLNPYQIRPVVEAVSKAWAGVMSFSALQEKSRGIESSINAQASKMIETIKAASAGSSGERSLHKITATEEWCKAKLADVKKHLREKEQQGLRAVHAAIPELLAVYDRVKDQYRRASVDSSSSAPQPLHGDSDDHEFDPEKLVQELEHGLQNLDLEDSY